MTVMRIEVLGKFVVEIEVAEHVLRHAARTAEYGDLNASLEPALRVLLDNAYRDEARVGLLARLNAARSKVGLQALAAEDFV